MTPTSEFLTSRGIVGVIHPIEAHDVAEFLVANARVRVEPPGWALVGEPTRFAVDAKEHTAGGELLGKAAQVRFRPAGTVWDYGDRSASRAPRGNRGDQPAEHIYRQAGTYTAAVAVHYLAEYKFDDETEWTPVQGMVVASPVTVTVTVLSARARLIKNR